jgi:hypothetical protein
MFNFNSSLTGLVWLALFSFVFYVAYIDNKVPVYFVLLATRFKQKLYSKFKLIWLHPKSPLFRMQVKLTSDQNARKLAKELNLDKNKDWK